ncbi:MAG: repeat containing protein [Nitrososphaeraceae archaeon]|nr:repeat containing protein [Nitrososphaeraceae archaeon]
MKKDKQLTKKVSLDVFSIILIGLITLTIFYFLNPQIKYIYQYHKSIGIDYTKVFATLSTPTDIATDNAGNVYVLDSENDKVQKFTTNGTFVKEWNIQRTKASELVPKDIATDSAGNVYVLDGGSNRVQKFTTNGTFVKEWNIN